MELTKNILADSQLSTRIKTKIEEIAQCVSNMPKTTPDLLGGKSGEVLFWAYYSRYLNSEIHEEKVTLILSDIFDQINDGYKYPELSRGLAGIGWTVEHLSQNNFINANTNNIIGNLDDYLYPYMIHFMRNGCYDYLHGALGIGLYYLSRLSESNPKKYLATLVDELETKCIRVDEGIAWKGKTKDGELVAYNLSLSHGIASIIVFLGRVYEKGIHTEKVAKLINEAVSFLIASKQDAKKYIFNFPDIVCKEKQTHTGRLAWCYNDLGVSMALWQVGRLLSNKEWEKEAIDILLYTTSIIKKDETLVMDAGLCHGAVGVAHIYSRMYTYTNIETFKNAAVFWLEESLTMDTFTDGLAGYKKNYMGWRNEYGFLQGVIGIGLAMICAVSGIEPKWDRVLLLS